MQPYLTQKQAAELLQVSIKTLQLLRRSGKLQFTRFGHRTIRYQPADIAQLAKQAKTRKDRR